MIARHPCILILYALIGFQSIPCKAYFGTERILDIEHNIVIWLGSFCIHQYETRQPSDKNSSLLTESTILADAGYNFYNAAIKYSPALSNTPITELFRMTFIEGFSQTAFDLVLHFGTRYLLGRFDRYLTSKKSTPALIDTQEINPSKEVAVTPTEATDIKDPYMQIRPMVHL